MGSALPKHAVIEMRRRQLAITAIMANGGQRLRASEPDWVYSGCTNLCRVGGGPGTGASDIGCRSCEIDSDLLGRGQARIPPVRLHGSRI